MIGSSNGVNRILSIDCAILAGGGFITLRGIAPAVHLQHPFIPVEATDASRTISKVVGATYHESFGIDPRCLDTVGSSKFMLVFPGEGVPKAYAGFGESGSGDEVYHIDKMGSQVGNRPM